MTQIKMEAFFLDVSFFLVVIVAVGENIDDLKFNTFLGRRGMINKTIITLKINL